MSFSYTRLRRPKFIFGNEARFSTAFQGLTNAGPLDSGSCPREPRILFVFAEEFKALANQLFIALKNGVGPYQGSDRLFGFQLKTSNVSRLATFSIAGRSPAEAARTYQSAIEKHLADNNEGVDLALVVHPKTDEHDQERNPYLAAKFPLLASEIPTQVVTSDLLERSDQFQWSVANIALAMFAKMGGSPWAVETDFTQDTLIVGINRAKVRLAGSSDSHRYYGFATTFGHNGVFRSTTLFPPAGDKAQFVAGLETSIHDALGVWKARTGTPVNLIIHLDRQELDRDEVGAIESALRKAEPGTVRSFAVLRLSDRTNMLLMNPEQSSCSPPPGVMVRVAGHRAILQIGGLDPTDRSAGKAAPGPWHVSLNRGALQPLPIPVLCSNLLAMAAMNWRALNADVSPVSVSYPRRVAELLGRFAEAGYPVETLKGKRVMERVWFI